MKYRAHFITIAATSLVLGCAATGATLSSENDIELECFVVEAAGIANSNRRYELVDRMTRQEQLVIANQGHTIAGGNSTVIAVREFSGRKAAVDGQQFKKLTILLNDPVATGMPIEVTDSRFTSGSSAFVAWGLYYVSIDEIRTVEVVDRDSHRILIVKQELPSFRVPDGLTGNIKVDFECELKSKSLDKLSAWEGRPDTENNPFYP